MTVTRVAHREVELICHFLKSVKVVESCVVSLSVTAVHGLVRVVHEGNVVVLQVLYQGLTLAVLLPGLAGPQQV